VNEGCELAFIQINVPDKLVKYVEQGWIDYYWQLCESILKND